MRAIKFEKKTEETRQSKPCGFCIYILNDSFDQSKSMVRFRAGKSKSLIR